MRLGLCCVFADEDIRFRTITARILARLSTMERAARLRGIAQHNAAALRKAIEFCGTAGIGCFRVNSQILPLKTHPEYGYETAFLGDHIVGAYRACGKVAGALGVRLTFHPDQFVVLNSPEPRVVANSLAEIEYQAEVAGWIGADVINIHAGGGYGDKASALKRLVESVGRLSNAARGLITLENDDRIYRPADLLPVCENLGLPFVYDVHHHRCCPDGLGVQETTALALKTWDREPLFHVSSPREGWDSSNPRPHAEYIDAADFPVSWNGLDITVEVEAKAKENAVRRLAAHLGLADHRRTVGGEDA